MQALPWEGSQERDGAPSHADPRSFENQLALGGPKMAEE